MRGTSKKKIFGIPNTDPSEDSGLKLHPPVMVLTVLLLFSVSCRHRTVVTTEPPGAYLTLDGESLGKVPAEGLSLRLKPGFGPVSYRLVYIDGYETSGEIDRSSLAWGPFSVAALSTLVCVPASCGAGLCLANPGWGLGVLTGAAFSPVAARPS